jgi:threonine dehydrogenase-like Zn-dependent dehydrogenase
MRQLTFIRRGVLEWRDLEPPQLQDARDALVRPFAVARCDLDIAFLLNSMKTRLRMGVALGVVDPRVLEDFGRDPFAGPFAYGHECVAQVIQVGQGVNRVAVGDVVIVPFQISCGQCMSCQRGLTSHCDTERRSSAISAYGFSAHIGGVWGGAMSDTVRVPYADHMLIKVPAGINPVSLASASDNIPDGWRGVGPHLMAHPGARALILGGQARSVGLYAAGLAVAMGAERVDYVDTNQQRLDIAERLGARPIPRLAGRKAFNRLLGLAHGGYPIVFDADGRDNAIDFAIRNLAHGGVCTAAAYYFKPGTKLPVWHMMVKSLRFETGYARPSVHLPDILDLVARGRFDPGLITTRLADWDDAPVALLDPTTKVVVHRAMLANLQATPS